MAQHGVQGSGLTGQESSEVGSQPTFRTQAKPEDVLAGIEAVEGATTALQLALEQMTWARIRLSGLGTDPARALSVAITQCETTMLWLAKAKVQVQP